MVVNEIMSKNPVHIGPTASIFAALNLLNDLDVRHLLVVENGELRGIISDRDIRSLSAVELEKAALAESKLDLSFKLKQRVSDFMNANVFSVDPEASVVEVIDIMLDQKIGAVPVVDSDNKIVGIVSYVDILKEAAHLL